MTIGRIDSIGDQSTSPGTSDFVIDGVAVLGMLAFAGKLTDGVTYRYRAQNSANTAWEVGSGVWTAATSTLSRVSVYQSSNGGAKTNFTDVCAVVVAMTAADFADAATDANISITDITTNNVSTAKHGFAPKAPNDATKFLDGTGAYSVPAGGGTPAGSGTELQYRNAGAFGAIAGSAWDAVNSKLTVTGKGSAGSPALVIAPTSGTSSTTINDNGTVVINADVSSGSFPLLIKYNSSTVYSFGFSGNLGLTGVIINWSGDAGLQRDAAGRLLVSDGGGTPMDLKLRGLWFGSMLTVGTLPSAAASSGLIYRVSDSLAPAVGSTVSSGGSAKCSVQSDGSAWKVVWIA